MYNTFPSTFAHDDPPSAEDCPRLLKKAEAEWTRKLRKIADRTARGEHREARLHVRRFLQNRLCKIAAMVKANRSMKRRRRSDAELVCAAFTLDLWHACPEPVMISGEKKPNGTLRLVANFGLYGRAGQIMCKEALKALHQGLFPSWQFGVPSGRDDCMEALSAKIKSGGVSHFAELDIDNFFGSINPEALENKELGLPTEVIRNFVSARNYRYSFAKGTKYNVGLLKACRSGVPQGSIASPIVAAIVIAKAMKDRDVQSIINYVDNFAIVAISKEDAAVQIEALHAALGSSFYGTFSLSNVQMRPISEGWQFVGYDCYLNDEGDVEYEPRERSLLQAKQRLVKVARDMRRPGYRLAAVKDKLAKAITDWKGGFPLSTSARSEVALDHLMHYLTSSRCPLKGIDLPEIYRRSDLYLDRLRKALTSHERYSPAYGAWQFP